MYLSKSQISEGKYVSWLGDQRIATSIKTPLIDGGFPPQIFQIYLKMEAFQHKYFRYISKWRLSTTNISDKSQNVWQIALYAVRILAIEKTGLNSDEIEGFLATNISGINLESWETD